MTMKCKSLKQIDGRANGSKDSASLFTNETDDDDVQIIKTIDGQNVGSKTGVVPLYLYRGQSLNYFQRKKLRQRHFRFPAFPGFAARNKFSDIQLAKSWKRCEIHKPDSSKSAATTLIEPRNMFQKKSVASNVSKNPFTIPESPVLSSQSLAVPFASSSTSSRISHNISKSSFASSDLPSPCEQPLDLTVAKKSDAVSQSVVCNQADPAVSVIKLQEKNGGIKNSENKAFQSAQKETTECRDQQRNIHPCNIRSSTRSNSSPVGVASDLKRQNQEHNRGTPVNEVGDPSTEPNLQVLSTEVKKNSVHDFEYEPISPASSDYQVEQNSSETTKKTQIDSCLSTSTFQISTTNLHYLSE